MAKCAKLTDEITMAWERKPTNFAQNKKVAKEGGSIAGVARKKLEKKIGEKIVSKLNARKLHLLKD